MPHYSAYKPSLELEKKSFNETVIIIAAITIILGIIYLNNFPCLILLLKFSMYPLQIEWKAISLHSIRFISD